MAQHSKFTRLQSATLSTSHPPFPIISQSCVSQLTNTSHAPWLKCPPVPQAYDDTPSSAPLSSLMCAGPSVHPGAKVYTKYIVIRAMISGTTANVNGGLTECQNEVLLLLKKGDGTLFTESKRRQDNPSTHCFLRVRSCADRRPMITASGRPDSACSRLPIPLMPQLRPSFRHPKVPTQLRSFHELERPCSECRMNLLHRPSVP